MSNLSLREFCVSKIRGNRQSQNNQNKRDVFCKAKNVSLKMQIRKFKELEIYKSAKKEVGNFATGDCFDGVAVSQWQWIQNNSIQILNNKCRRFC